MAASYLTDYQQMRNILKETLKKNALLSGEEEWRRRLKILVSSLSSESTNPLLLLNDNNLKQIIATIFEFQFDGNIEIIPLTDKLKEFLKQKLDKLTEEQAGCLFFSVYNNLDVLLCQEEDKERRQDSNRGLELFDNFKKQCA